MSTIDMTQVAGIQAVNAEGNVIGTLSVDDLTELVAANIVQSTKKELASAQSAAVLAETSTLAATDEYEDQLALDTNPAYIRSLDTNGNPKRTAIASLATVVGGLIGLAASNKNGLASKDWCFPKGGTVSPNQTIDDLEAGIYSVGAGNDNIPGSSTGVLFVDINLAYGYRIQRFYDTKGNKLVRINAGTWGVWK